MGAVDAGRLADAVGALWKSESEGERLGWPDGGSEMKDRVGSTSERQLHIPYGWTAALQPARNSASASADSMVDESSESALSSRELESTSI